ncbi:MAG: hypothetical protein LBG76_00595 [Treponema sp.]|jgi:hypothetical protein|nr:hypothetical protein [Treponema sp.]
MMEYEKRKREALLQYFDSMGEEKLDKIVDNVVSYYKSVEKEMDLQGLGKKLRKLAKQEKGGK